MNVCKAKELEGGIKVEYKYAVKQDRVLMR